MKKVSKQTQTEETKILNCSFSDLKVCLKQSSEVKLNMTICTNCLLGRIEKHLYGILKKLYSKS